MFKRKYLLISFLLAGAYMLVSHFCFYVLLHHVPSAESMTPDIPSALLFPASMMFVAGYSGGNTYFAIAGMVILCIFWLLFLPIVYAVGKIVKR